MAGFDQDAGGQDQGISLCVGRAEALPFADGAFDLVVAVTTLCFVDKGDRMFAEIGRALRPGGRLVIGELGKFSTWAARRRVKAWLGSPLWRHGRFRTPRELQRLASSSGLAPGPVQGAIYYPHANWAARRLASLDRWFSARCTFGAAFLVLAAEKPPA